MKRRGKNNRKVGGGSGGGVEAGVVRFLGAQFLLGGQELDGRRKKRLDQ